MKRRMGPLNRTSEEIGIQTLKKRKKCETGERRNNRMRDEMDWMKEEGAIKGRKRGRQEELYICVVHNDEYKCEIYECSGITQKEYEREKNEERIKKYRSSYIS